MKLVVTVFRAVHALLALLFACAALMLIAIAIAARTGGEVFALGLDAAGAQAIIEAAA